MLLPSRREGYGMVVVEASAHATPSIVVAGEDNAATELVADSVNGVIAAERRSARPLAAAIVRRVPGGKGAAREHRSAGIAEHAEELSLESSLEKVLASYARLIGAPAGLFLVASGRSKIEHGALSASALVHVTYDVRGVPLQEREVRFVGRVHAEAVDSPVRET